MNLVPGTLRARFATLTGAVLLAALALHAVHAGIAQREDARNALRVRAESLAGLTAAQLRSQFSPQDAANTGQEIRARLESFTRLPGFRSIALIGAEGRIRLRVDHALRRAVTPPEDERSPPPKTYALAATGGERAVVAWAPMWPAPQRAWVRLELDALETAEGSDTFLIDSLQAAALLALAGIALTLFWLHKPLSDIARASEFPNQLGADAVPPLTLNDGSHELKRLEHGLNDAACRLARSHSDSEIVMQRFLCVMEQLGELVFETDDELRTTYLNPAWQALRKQPTSELLGRPLPDLLQPARSDALRVELLELAAGEGDLCSMPLQVADDDGEPRWLSFRIRPAGNGNEQSGYVGSLADISAQQQAEFGLRESIENAEEASRTKSAFLANMSHELRTPMNAIIGMTDLVLESTLDSEQRHFLSSARAAADNLLGIINDVLDFSKIEAGRLDFEQIPFGLRDCVEQAVAAHRESARSKGLVIDYRIDPTVPDALEGDPHRLRQVLQNLIGNAIKFTDAGHVVTRVSAVNSEREEALIHFAVEDTGIGIAEDQQDWIFDAFSQVDASATRRYGGTGLGLSVARRLVERMQGTIEVVSRLGKGSTFSFNARFARTPEHSEGTSSPPLESLQIMLAAESDFEIGHIAEGLIGWQMRPEVETLGMRVLARMRHASSSDAPFHVLILGDHLGDMDAFELSRRLRADPAIQPPVIILAASSGQRGDAAQCRNIGIDAYLTRPLQALDLLDAIMLSLSRHRDGPLITRHSLREQRQSLQVLVAADDSGRNLAQLLERLGHVVHSVNNGVEAVESCHAARFDVILLDALLGSPDALTVLVRLRAMESGSEQPTPVIALAPDGYAELASSLAAAGADETLRSPPATAALVSALRHLTSAAPSPADEGDDGEQRENVLHVFDVARALEYLDNDEDLLRQLIGVYLEGERGLRMRLREALAQGDMRAAHPALHAIGGSVGSFMADATLAAVARIEARCREGNATDMGSELQQLWQEMDRLASALQEVLEQAPTTPVT